MTNPTKVIFVCDESGAKGYADQKEKYPGEVGVFAGILIPNESLSVVSPKFQELYERYKPASGKLHIADLDNHLKESLRLDVYQAIREFGLPCFWYAIHVAGLQDFYSSQGAIFQDVMKKSQETNVDSVARIQYGSPRSTPVSMHEELFSGLYGHLIAFLEERNQKVIDIEIRTDQIDNPIIKNFEEIAKKLLSQDAVVDKVTGFDTVISQPVKGQIKVEVKFPPEMGIEAVVRSLSINPVREGDGLVLAADVLANSLNYLFKNRKDEERYKDLNTPEAVAAHPLSDHLDAFLDWGAGDILGDCLYRHPSAPQT
jgi:hypothetical protein